MWWGKLSRWRKTLQDEGPFFSSGSKWVKVTDRKGSLDFIQHHKGNPYCNVCVWPEQIVHLPAPVQTDVGPQLEPRSTPGLPTLWTDCWFGCEGDLRSSDQPERRNTLWATKHFVQHWNLGDVTLTAVHMDHLTCSNCLTYCSANDSISHNALWLFW